MSKLYRAPKGTWWLRKIRKEKLYFNTFAFICKTFGDPPGNFAFDDENNTKWLRKLYFNTLAKFLYGTQFFFFLCGNMFCEWMQKHWKKKTFLLPSHFQITIGICQDKMKCHFFTQSNQFQRIKYSISHRNTWHYSSKISFLSPFDYKLLSFVYSS